VAGGCLPFTATATLFAVQKLVVSYWDNPQDVAFLPSLISVLSNVRLRYDLGLCGPSGAESYPFRFSQEAIAHYRRTDP